jgi:putative membrane protein
MIGLSVEYRAMRLPYRAWLLIIFLVALLISVINPADRFDFLLEHVPTVAALALLMWVDRRQPLSNLAYSLIFVYMMLHVLGAHYLYSHVPYDVWAQRLFGFDITGTFGFRRNHYDRLVHFAHGLLLLEPMRELAMRWLRIDGVRSVIVAGAFLAVLSTVYELAEWLIAVVMDSEQAEMYNGQQGDMFDAQKDMALALLGSTISGLIIILTNRRKPAGS